jgi:hypothetical protein
MDNHGMRAIGGRARPTWTFVIFTITALIGFFAVIVAFPWLVGSAVGWSDDWHQLSEVGQAYGGVSAMLSGLAFCGIAGSLLLQWRQVRLAQMMMLRERHFELVKLGLDDSNLRFPSLSEKSEAESRRWIVRNLWVAHWLMLWDMGSLTPPRLRMNFDDIFREDEAVQWWTAYGSFWIDNPRRHHRTFLAVANEAYRQATGANPGSQEGHVEAPEADASLGVKREHPADASDETAQAYPDS